MGEATGPWLSRQCHLLPLHTHPHPTLQGWGWAQRRALLGEPQRFEAVAELLFPIFQSTSGAFRWELRAQSCGRTTRRTCSPSSDITAFSPSVNPPNVPRSSLQCAKYNRKGPSEPAKSIKFFIKYTSSLGTNLKIYKHYIPKCLHCNKIELQIQEKQSEIDARTHTDGEDTSGQKAFNSVCVNYA